MARHLKTIAALIAERSAGRFAAELTVHYCTVGRKVGRIYVTGASEQKTSRLVVTEVATGKEVFRIGTAPGFRAGEFAESWLNENGLLADDELTPRRPYPRRRRR